MTQTINTTEFARFHALLTKGRPGYTPYYIKLEKGGKNPIKKKWKEEHTVEGHTYQDALKWLGEGYNVGIVSTDRDPLVIIDNDDIREMTDVKPTLSDRSRKRTGSHNYYFTEDLKAKVNIATEHNGEVRANWQYVVAAGSYVPTKETDPEIDPNLPPEQKLLLGKYTIEKELPVANITFDEFPAMFREQSVKDEKSLEAKEVKGNKEFLETNGREGNKSKLWRLPLFAVVPSRASDQARFPSLFHDSSTGMNTSVNGSGTLLNCWRHNVSHNALTALAVRAGLAGCQEAGNGHHGKSKSCIDFKDAATQFRLWEYARQNGIIPKDDPFPSAKAMVYYALTNKLCEESDVVDGWKLPLKVHQAVLRNFGLDNHSKREQENKTDKPKPTINIRTDGYCEEKGCIGYRKIRTDKETGETHSDFNQIGNFTWEYLKEIHKEDGTIEYETNIKCLNDTEPRKFTLDTKTLSDNKLLAIAIRNACQKAVFDTKDIAGVSQCFDELKKDVSIPVIKKVRMGWHDNEYIMKSIIITKDGIKKNDKYLIDVPASSKARFIDMFDITDEQFTDCGKHITSDLLHLHDSYFIRMAIADTYGAPFQRKLEETNVDEIRYSKIDRGTPQAGKSFAERLMQSHYGIIPAEGGFVTWGSTTYSVEAEGGNYRDVLFLADDLSKDLLNNESEKVKFHRMLHNYTSGAGRDRLKQNGEQKASKPIGGIFIITAENTVTEGASNAGRICYIDVPDPSEEEKKQYRIFGARCQEMKHLYPGFMARYIADVVKNENWLNEYKATFIKIRDEFLQTSGDDRSVKMHAIRYVHFEMFCDFMSKNGFMEDAEKATSELKQRMLENIEKTSSSIKSERHSTVILDKLQQLIASGTIPRVQRHDEIDEAHSKNPVGIVLDDMKAPELAYIIPDVVIGYLKRHMKEISKTFEVNKDDIGKELKRQGYLKDCDVGRNTYQLRFNGSRVNTWCVSRELIGIPNAPAESQVSLFDIARSSRFVFENMGFKDTEPTQKQYNMVINNLIDSMRPGISRSDKHRIWSELEPLVELTCIGKGWNTKSKAKLEDKILAEKEAAEQKLSKQTQLPQQPTPITVPHLVPQTFNLTSQ